MFGYTVEFVACVGKCPVGGSVISIVPEDNRDKVIDTAGDLILKILSPGGDLYAPCSPNSWFIIKDVRRI